MRVAHSSIRCEGMETENTSSETGASSFEDSLTELESIVHDLEEGQLGLADALTRYEQGVKHLKHCYQLLQEAERKIELLTGVTEDGTPITQPLDESSETLPESAGRKRRTKKSPSQAESPALGSDADRDIDAQRGST
jgi:exodeoxyribonuclease VII small subunit